MFALIALMIHRRGLPSKIGRGANSSRDLRAEGQKIRLSNSDEIASMIFDTKATLLAISCS